MKAVTEIKLSLISLLLCLLKPQRVYSSKATNYHLLANNQRASTNILQTTSVTSLTTCAIFCANIQHCDAYNIGPVDTAGFRMCNAVMLRATPNITEAALWQIFAGKIWYLFHCKTISLASFTLTKCLVNRCWPTIV